MRMTGHRSTVTTFYLPEGVLPKELLPEPQGVVHLTMRRLPIREDSKDDPLGSMGGVVLTWEESVMSCYATDDDDKDDDKDDDLCYLPADMPQAEHAAWHADADQRIKVGA